MKQINRNAFFLWLIIIHLSLTAFSQNNYFEYKFLNLQENQFRNIQDTMLYGRLMQQFSKSRHTGTTDINIIHIGDSHLQAGFLPNAIRSNFQQYFSKDTNTNLGFVFPYAAAGTNNPGHYHSETTGKWKSIKTAQKSADHRQGVSGIILKTRDTSATLKITLKDYFPRLEYHIQYAQILCQYPPSAYTLYVNGKKKLHTKSEHAVQVQFQDAVDTLLLEIHKKDASSTAWFSLSGVVIKQKEKCLNYHAMGVNGAKAISYLYNERFPKQIQRFHPDWIIVSLGTNEAYNCHFDKTQFHRNLTKLVNTLKQHTDSAWILLTTPGNALRDNQFENPNNATVREIILQVARELNCGYWDFYHVMGDAHAIHHWYQSNLTAPDKLHLNKAGYHLKANLFFDAFLQAFQHYCNNRHRFKQ